MNVLSCLQLYTIILPPPKIKRKAPYAQNSTFLKINRKSGIHFIKAIQKDTPKPIQHIFIIVYFSRNKNKLYCPTGASLHSAFCHTFHCLASVHSKLACPVKYVHSITRSFIRLHILQSTACNNLARLLVDNGFRLIL